MEKDILNNILVCGEIDLINKIFPEWFTNEIYRKIFISIKRIYDNKEINKELLIKNIIDNNIRYKDILLSNIKEIYAYVSFDSFGIEEIKAEYENKLISKEFNNFNKYDLEGKKEIIFRLNNKLLDNIESDSLYEYNKLKIDVIKSFDNKKEYKLKTNWKSINDEIEGFDSSYTIIGGRPSMGKSDLMLNLINAFRKHHGIFFTLEEKAEKMIKKLFVFNYDIDRRKIIKNLLTDKEKENFYNLPDYNLLMYDKSCGINKIVDIIYKENEKEKIEYIVVDYLQLIKRYSNDWRQEIADISKKFQYIKQDMNIAVFLGSQVNARFETEYLTHNLGHLKESGDLEADVDNVIFLEGERKSNERNFYFAKQRDGTIGYFKMDYDKTRGIFYEKVEQY